MQRQRTVGIRDFTGTTVRESELRPKTFRNGFGPIILNMPQSLKLQRPATSSRAWCG